MTARTRKATASAEPQIDVPAADAAPEETPEPAVEIIPVPTRIKAAWFPAQLLLPDGKTVLQRAKIYAAEQGLYVYTSVPQDPAVPDWYAELDFSTGGKPPNGYAAYNGFRMQTSKGEVTLTLDRGCGCGWPLKRWSPEFARRIVAW